MVATETKTTWGTMSGTQPHTLSKITHVLIVMEPVQLGQRWRRWGNKLSGRSNDPDMYWIDLLPFCVEYCATITSVAKHATCNADMLSWRNNQSRKAAAIPLSDKTPLRGAAVTSVAKHATRNAEMLSWRNNEIRDAAAIPLSDKTPLRSGPSRPQSITIQFTSISV